MAQHKLSIKELIATLQEPNTKRYVPHRQPIVDRDEVKKHMRLKWKDPGHCNLEFSKAPCIRPKMLNEWQLERIHMSVRSYQTPKGAHPYRFDKESRGFPDISVNAYPTKFQKHLRQVQSDHQDRQFEVKRSSTEGMEDFISTRYRQLNGVRCFRPASTNSSLFGFSFSPKVSMRKHTNIHMKTVNL